MLTAVCGFEALTAASAGLALIAIANAATAIWLVRSARTEAAAGMRVRLDADGTLWLRHASGAADEDSDRAAAIPAEARFVSAPLLVLAARDSAIPIWRDALPSDVFRRLIVAARWPRLSPGTVPGADKQAN